MTEAWREETLSLRKSLDHLIDRLAEKNIEYAESWKKRGGVGAFMMLARKWDRIENAMQTHNYDLFTAALTDSRPEGLIDDIDDLLGYLILARREILIQKKILPPKSTEQ